MFIGYPRSGHTLVATFLDAHQDAIIGHELDALKYIEANFSKEQIDTVHCIYRTLYQEGLNTSQALKIIEEKFEDTVEKQEILSFIKNSI